MNELPLHAFLKVQWNEECADFAVSPEAALLKRRLRVWGERAVL